MYNYIFIITKTKITYELLSKHNIVKVINYSSYHINMILYVSLLFYLLTNKHVLHKKTNNNGILEEYFLENITKYKSYI